tara:strand:- start:185 stop:685 length:501 start_codon:yes stop_codon:yes gene_type:complete
MNIENILLNIQSNISEINCKLDRIYDKLEIEYTETDIGELKKVKTELDDNIIKKSLESNSLTGDFEIIRKVYFDVPKESFPIRHIDKKKYKYWLNNKWNIDIDAVYIKDVLLCILNSCYLRFNKYDRYKDNIDTYIKNQEYISTISTDDKYKIRLLNHVKNYITSV